MTENFLVQNHQKQANKKNWGDLLWTLSHIFTNNARICDFYVLYQC